MRFLALVLAVLAAPTALAEPLTVQVSVLDAAGNLVPVPGARVAVLPGNAVVAAEDALAVSEYSTDQDGTLTVAERPSPGEPLMVIAGMALRAVSVARVGADSTAATLVLPPEAILRIVVRNAAGHGLAGAEVLVAPEGPGDTGEFRQPGTVLFCSYTDPAGRCIFYRMDPRSRYRVRVKARGSALLTLRDVPVTRGDLELYVQRGAVVRGRVIAVPGGTPVPGALVAAGEARAKTDEAGAFELAGVEPGLQSLEVSAAGRRYVEHLRLMVRPGETRSGVLLRVQGLGRLAGRILGPDTRPATGAAVYLRYPPIPEFADDLPPGGIVPAGQSDDQGRFDFPDLLPAQGVDLIAIHPEFAPAVYYGYSILAGRSFETLILFRRGGGLAGTVVSEAGVPVAGAEVWAIDARDEPAGLLSGAVALPLTAGSTKTAEDGTFVLAQVAPGMRTLVVRHPDHLPLVLPGVSVVNGDDRSGLRLTLGRGAVIRTTVLSADDLPAAGAEVTLVPSIGAERTGRTDERGGFFMAGLPPGPYRMTVKLAGHAPFESPRLVPPVRDLIVRLVRGGGIDGRVLDGEGPDPADSAVVRLLIEGEPDPLAPDRPNYAEVGRVRATDPGARFSFGHARPGRYRLEAWTPDGRFGFAGGIEFDPAGPPVPVEIRVRGGWGVTGVVLSAATGAPLEGAEVAVLGVAGAPEPYRAVTDENGVYRIPSVAPGFHAVRAEAAGHCARILESVEVRRGVETMAPEIVLQHGSRITGSVRGADGRSLRGLQLTVESALHRVRIGARSDDWGDFAFENVSSGPWLLTLERLAESGGVRREQRLVTVEEGQDLHLDLRFDEGTTLSGRVTRAGVAVAHSLLEVFPLAGELVRGRRVLSTNTDGDGNYRIAGLPEGPALLLVSAGGPRSPPARFRILVEPGAVVRRDFVLLLSGIQGAAEDLDTGLPVAGVEVRIAGANDPGDRSGLARIEAEMGAVRAGEDGEFLAEGLPAGTYRLSARARGYGETVLDEVRVFEGGLTPVRVLLPPAGEVSGRVLDDAGRPVTGARVSFTPGDGGPPVGERDLKTDSEGRFCADFLAPGRYTATAEALGYGRAAVPDVDVSTGGSRELEIRLPFEGRLKVHVYGPGGIAIEGARVSLLDFWGRPVPFPGPPMGLLTPWEDPALTRRDGTCTVRSLAPGIYEVRATHADFRGPPVRVRVLDGELARAAVTLLRTPENPRPAALGSVPGSTRVK